MPATAVPSPPAPPPPPPAYVASSSPNLSLDNVSLMIIMAFLGPYMVGPGTQIQSMEVLPHFQIVYFYKRY